MFELLAECDKEEIFTNATERCIRKEAGSSPTMMETVFLNELGEKEIQVNNTQRCRLIAFQKPISLDPD